MQRLNVLDAAALVARAVLTKGAGPLARLQGPHVAQYDSFALLLHDLNFDIG